MTPNEIWQNPTMNPIVFCEQILGHLTWSKQREILKSVVFNEKTIVHSCHGVSKTFTLAEIAVWFLNIFPESKVISTAPTNNQVRDLLWAEIGRIYRKSLFKLEGECQQTFIKTGKTEHYAKGFSTDVQEKAEGFHAPQILFIIDEGKGVPGWFWDSIRGAMTSGFCRWVVASTTDGLASGEEFYKACTNSKLGWNKIHISAYDTPFMTGEPFYKWNSKSMVRETIPASELDGKIQIAGPKYIENSKIDWGEDSYLFRTKVLGNIENDSLDSIIKISDINKMFSNKFEENIFDPEVVGVDVARFGDDSSVFIKRKGRIMVQFEENKHMSLIDLSRKLKSFISENRKTKLLIDDTGVGGGLTDIMKAEGYNVVGVIFNSVANQEALYPNIISEMWYTVGANISTFSCPYNDRLLNELVNRRGKYDVKGRRCVESKDAYKKRGFRSPDFGDAFLLCFYDFTPLKNSTFSGVVGVFE